MSSNSSQASNPAAPSSDFNDPNAEDAGAPAALRIGNGSAGDPTAIGIVICSVIGCLLFLCCTYFMCKVWCLKPLRAPKARIHVRSRSASADQTPQAPTPADLNTQSSRLARMHTLDLDNTPGAYESSTYLERSVAV
eukprot:4877765-Pleurochrysis_carterae.AAC.8